RHADIAAQFRRKGAGIEFLGDLVSAVRSGDALAQRVLKNDGWIGRRSARNQRRSEREAVSKHAEAVSGNVPDGPRSGREHQRHVRYLQVSGELHHQSRGQSCAEVRRLAGREWRGETLDRSGYRKLRKIVVVIPATTLASIDQLLGPKGYLHRP